jgi:diguanylate cyclase (GGDEF)-like protein
MAEAAARNEHPSRRARALPAYDAWVWLTRLPQEQMGVLVRAAIAPFVAAGAWWLLSRGLAPHPLALRLLVAFVGLHAAVSAVLLYRRPRLAQRFGYAFGLLDLSLIPLWIAATGGRSSPSLALLCVGAVVAPFRLPPGAALAVALLYSGLYAVLGGPAHLIVAAAAGLAGAGLVSWPAREERLRHEALFDPLTGALTRSQGLFQIRELLAGGHLPLAVALLDLDGFKQVNDRFGHEAGDEVLREYVRRVLSRVRPQDLVIRYGGDELLLVWPDTAGEAAASLARAIRAAVGQQVFRVPRTTTGVRLASSAGVAAAGPGDDVDGLLRLADARLYLAKHRQRLPAPRPARVRRLPRRRSRGS